MTKDTKLFEKYNCHSEYSFVISNDREKSLNA